VWGLLYDSYAGMARDPSALLWEGGPGVHEQGATYWRTTICSSEDVASTQDVVMQFRNVVNISQWPLWVLRWEIIRIILKAI